MALNKRRFAKRLILAVLMIFNILGMTGIVLHKRREAHMREMERRYPFKAYSHGQALTGDYGQPLRFSTQDLAHRYEQDYGDLRLTDGAGCDCLTLNAGLERV